MTYFMWFLRIVHIVAGVFWVGGTLIMTFFLGPTVGATGEAGQKVVGHLMNNLKFSQRMSAASGLTILAGFILYWIDSDGFTSAWMSSGAGTGFGIGAVFALIGMAFGIMIGRTMKALAEFVVIEDNDATQVAGVVIQAEPRMQIVRHFVITITRGGEIETNDKDQIPGHVRLAFTLN